MHILAAVAMFLLIGAGEDPARGAMYTQPAFQGEGVRPVVTTAGGSGFAGGRYGRMPPRRQGYCYRRYLPGEMDRYFKHRVYRVPREYRQEFGLYYYYFGTPEYRRNFRDFKDEFRYRDPRPAHPRDERSIRRNPGYRFFFRIN